MRTVAVLQHRLLHYRVRLFEELRNACLRRGIDLMLVHGQASPREQKKKDTGMVPWALTVTNRFWEIGSVDVLWQPLPRAVRRADLTILMQENRILSNYPLLVSRLWSRQKIAYWGHGKNFQSIAPDGLRERWKDLMLRRVDWWFAYTDITAGILTRAGFPQERITCLNNAIDTAGFTADLASVSDDDIRKERSRLGIPDRAPVGLFCGSLYPEKRIDVLLAAADIIRSRLPGFTLVIIGDGPSMAGIHAFSAKRPWLHALGLRTGREKALYYRMSDCVLNPGLVGLHIVDAFCSGLPMITTNNAAHSPEIAYFRDGENGIMTGDSVAEYAAAVSELLVNEGTLARMKREAAADAGKYTLDAMVTHFADGIEKALAQ